MQTYFFLSFPTVSIYKYKGCGTSELGTASFPSYRLLFAIMYGSELIWDLFKVMDALFVTLLEENLDDII